MVSAIEHEMIVIKVNNDVFANIFNSGTNAVCCCVPAAPATRLQFYSIQR